VRLERRDAVSRERRVEPVSVVEVASEEKVGLLVVDCVDLHRHAHPLSCFLEFFVIVFNRTHLTDFHELECWDAQRRAHPENAMLDFAADDDWALLVEHVPLDNLDDGREHCHARF